MSGARKEDVTGLLVAWRAGDVQARDRLIPRLYGELRRLAAHHLRGERPGHTLRPTALVHEAYLRLVDPANVEWKNRAHFLAVASQTMRRILIDYARGRLAAKRTPGKLRVSVEEDIAVQEPRAVEILALDELLSALVAIAPRHARIVELRFFGGLSVDETAEVLAVSPRTVKREWALARAWLYRGLAQSGCKAGGGS